MNFLLAQVSKLVAHDKFLKSTILIKTGNICLSTGLSGVKSVIKLKVPGRQAVLSALSGEGS